MKVRKLHAISATVFGAFVGLHLANHLVGLSGAERHVAFMTSARVVYRLPVLELALLVCVAIQIASGLAMVMRGWRKRRGYVAWLQAASGAYLAVFLLIHVGAVLFGRWVLHLDTDFHFAAAGVRDARSRAFFAPYYFLSIVALFAHAGCAAYWHSLNRSRRMRMLVLAVPLSIGAVTSLFVVRSLAV
jgi:hypothetical protein